LEILTLEDGLSSKIEHFVFMMTDGKGRRMYGVCLRGLFKGVSNRFDVGRRIRNCLCIITAYPFFSMFRVMLLQLHSLALLDPDCNSDSPKSLRCWRFLESVYQQGSLAKGADRLLLLRPITVSCDSHPELQMQQDLTLTPPGSLQGLQADLRVLPLLELLGPDRFLRLLTAILCERRIVFVADDVELLSSCVLSAASMVAPFQWQHIFIPLLPSSLLTYVAAPTPFLFGVRGHLLPGLRERLAADLAACPSLGVLLVDLRCGELQAFGPLELVDLGEAP